MDIYQHRRHNKNLLMVHLIFVTKYRKKDRNNLKLHRKIAPKWGRSFLIKSVNCFTRRFPCGAGFQSKLTWK